MKNHTLQQGHMYKSMDANIRMLAHVESSHSPFISCYIDLGGGVSQAINYMAAQKHELMLLTAGHEQQELEKAIDIVIAELKSNDFECQGLALFSRSHEGGHYLSALELQVPVRNHISVFQVPDILPLILMQHEYGQYLQASIRENAVYVHEKGLGHSALRGMAPIPAKASEAEKVAIARRILERTMRSSLQFDVILDGESVIIKKILQAMPALLRRKVIQLIPVQPCDNDRKQDAVSKLTHMRYREFFSSSRLYDAIIAEHSPERLTTGIDECLNAVRWHSVSAVYLSTDELRQNIRSPWATEQVSRILEITRLAIQFEIPVEFISRSQVMQQSGGIVCLVENEPMTHKPGMTITVDALQAAM